MIALYTLIFSLFVATALVPLLVRYADALQLLDIPDERKTHRGAIPRIGGIAIAVGVLLAVLLFLPDRREIIAYFAGALIIFLFGVADDRLNLDYRLKFFGQIAGALVFVLGGDLCLARVPFIYGAVMPDWVGIPLTVLAIVGVTNAINMSDGMDGLAGGTTLLSAGMLGYLAYLGGDKHIALLALALIGATLGFLRYNTFPARIFMGDGGSQFLGFSAAALGILLIERSNTAISPLVPLVVLGLPIIDTLHVMIRRILSGVSPFTPDRQHLHHRLLDAGLNQYESVVMIYGLQSVLVMMAWWLQYAPDLLLLAVFLLFMLGLLVLMRLWRTQHMHGRAVLQKLDVIYRAIEHVRGQGLLIRVSRGLVVYCLVALFPVAALLVEGVTPDIGWLALLIGTMLMLALFSKALPLITLTRLAAFVLAVCLTYLVEMHGLAAGLDVYWFRAGLVLIAFGIALKLRLGTDGFQINGLDVLVVLVIAIVPNMPFVRELGLRITVIETLVLFYACELVLIELADRWNVWRISLLASLAILVIRAL